MAIAVERKTKEINWLALSIGLFALVLVGATLLYLFILPPPAIENFIQPVENKEIQDGVEAILGSGLDVPSIVNKAKALETPIPLPLTGDLGRENPFLPI
ncbi:MAG: hypothetical protein Q8L47_00055 [bacterium]|nr:hypothetical protein [bacterium]